MAEGPPVILVGAGMHGRVVRDTCGFAGVEVAGFLDDFSPVGTRVDDRRIVGPTARLDDPEFIAAHRFIVTIGNNKARRKIATAIRRAGGQLAVAIHPNCSVSPTARIGSGTVLIGANMVFSHVSIGQDVLIDPDATLGADSTIADGVYVCPGVHLGAKVELGENSFIGLGAVVVPEVKIGEGAIVGAGAVVIRDVPVETLVIGNPAVAKGPAKMDDFSPYPARSARG
jgi:sugar O-acyltransferase (sialic acid O-acetyltransferase NeuD family)